MVAKERGSMSSGVGEIQGDIAKMADNMDGIKQREGASHNLLTNILGGVLDATTDARKHAAVLGQVLKGSDAIKAREHLQSMVDLARETQDLSANTNQDVAANVARITEGSETIQEEAEGVLYGLSEEVAQRLNSVADLLDKLSGGMLDTLQSSSQLNELATTTQAQLKGIQENI